MREPDGCQEETIRFSCEWQISTQNASALCALLPAEGQPIGARVSAARQHAMLSINDNGLGVAH